MKNKDKKLVIWRKIYDMQIAYKILRFIVNKLVQFKFLRYRLDQAVGAIFSCSNSLKLLGNQFIYPERNISSTERGVNLRIGQAWLLLIGYWSCENLICQN